MLTIHVWPKRLKEFLLTHPLYKSPAGCRDFDAYQIGGATFYRVRVGASKAALQQ